MSSNSKKTGLATGASMIALGVAGPAFAATVQGIQEAPAAGSIVPVTIHVDATDVFVFGTDDVDSGVSAAALVNSAVTLPNPGAVYQTVVATISGDADISIAAGGSLTIQALAGATTVDASAAADAQLLNNGMRQTMTAPIADAAITNGGNLKINAEADAISANGLAGTDGANATASATMGAGISQSGSGATSVALHLTNATGATLSLAADANANGVDLSQTGGSNGQVSVDASANTGAGVLQSASGVGANTVNITNANALTISATAAGNGTDLLAGASSNATVTASAEVSADASVGIGVMQTATGGVSGSAAIVNGGAFTIAATGTATGGNIDAVASGASSAYADASVNANANVGDGISQQATGTATSAVSIANSATLSIAATADATGNALNATASSAYASASASASIAATATLGTGIFQSAGGGAATASIANTGTLNIGAISGADGVDLVADVSDASDASVDAAIWSTARVTQGISQVASGSSGSATISNGASNTIAISATGRATGSNVAASASAYSSASATAYVDGRADINTGISQVGAGTATGAAAITNNGTLSIIADAGAVGTDIRALGTGALTESSGEAWVNADASIGLGISQVGAGGTGATIADLTNNGSLTISAIADAQGTDIAGKGEGGSAEGYASVEAHASLGGGISQVATGGAGTGSATVTNASGKSLLITSVANAEGNGLAATASGTDALASASVTATAILDSGIAQVGAGTTASNATIANSGTLNIASTATANGTNITVSAKSGGANQAEAVGEVFASAGSTEGGSDGIVQTAAGGTAAASITNSSTLAITATATAGVEGVPGGEETDPLPGISALASNAAQVTAEAGIGAEANLDRGITQNATGTVATAGITNSGTLTVGAQAHAVGSDLLAKAIDAADAQARAGATAYAAVDSGITQNGSGSVSGDAALTNSATLSITADALGQVTGVLALASSATAGSAYAGAVVDADIGVGVRQSASGPDASALLTNASTGVLNVTATADALVTSATASLASADGGDAQIWVYAQAGIGTGISQTANGTTADATIANSGTINISAHANAAGTDTTAVVGEGVAGSAEASAYAMGLIEDGINQSVSGNSAIAALTNTGTINITAVGDASIDGGTAYGAAGIGGFDSGAGIVQSVEGGTVGTASITNSATHSITVSATANADADTVQGVALARGIHQDVSADDALASIDNAGTINLSATATLVGTQVTPASNGAASYGVEQSAYGSTAEASFVNSGTFNSTGSVTAANAVAGNVSAVANGVHQSVLGNGALSTTATFTNSGTFTVSSTGTIGAAGLDADIATNAGASAAGLVIDADAVTLAVDNQKPFSVTATARADDQATARAIGIAVNATEGALTGPSTAQVWTGDNTLSGTLSNSGALTVTASATVGTGGVGNVATADATGIVETSLVNNSTINNTNAITVSAITNGGTSTAVGIRINSFDTGADAPTPDAFGPVLAAVPTADDVVTINNVGTSLVARESVDGGTTWTHGLAIDTSGAPNAAVINLQGAGATHGVVYGDIDVSADDVINVSSGVTEFDGKINPGAELEGQLNIASGGTLYLKDKSWANNAYDGPAKVNVGAFSVAAGGTLAIDLPTAPNEADVLGYPTVSAVTADITGSTLEVHPNSSNGLYADSYTFNDVILTPGDALTGTGGLTGTFANVTTVSGTPLFTFTPRYNQNVDGGGTTVGGDVDLVMTRVAFGDAPNLTINQSSVGDGIEAVYDPEATGAFAGVVGDLFTQNAAGYADALDQLSGAPYASYLQSLTGLASRFNGLILNETDCPVVKIGERQPCRQENGGRIWGQINYGHLKKDGDAQASGYKADQYYMALGADFAVSPDTTLGIAGAYVKNDLDFDRYGAKIKADGFQAGAYLVYDPGQLYAKLVAAYSDLNGNSRRSVAIGPNSTGTIRGNPDVRVFSVSGELGYRVDMGGSTLTPYLNLEYDASKLKGFTETGLPGANLDIAGSSEDRFASQVGFKWAGKMGGLVPELKLGWRHQFGDRRAIVGAAFDGVAGSDFDVLSQSEKRDQAIVGLSVAGELSSNVYARLSYQGRINGDADSHAGGITVAMKLGGGK